MFKVPGTDTIYEDTHVVAKFRRILPPGDPAAGSKPRESTRKQALLQFFARHGGQRTVALSDIVDIR